MNTWMGWGLLAALLLTVGCARLPTPGPGTVERLQLSHRLGPGTAAITIDNPWGDVYVRRGEVHEVYVHAVVQRLGPRPASPDLRLDGDEHQAELRVRFGGADADCRRQQRDGSRLGRADITVFVPNDVDLNVRSACDGRIHTQHIRGDLIARTEAGSITASASGRAQLVSDSGKIRAFVEIDTDQPSVVESAGSIVLTMPPAVRAELSARGCDGLAAVGFEWGSIKTDARCRAARASLGDGGSPLTVLSRSSFVEIRLRGSARQ